jgi:hypothetical protein
MNPNLFNMFGTAVTTNQAGQQNTQTTQPPPAMQRQPGTGQGVTSPAGKNPDPKDNNFADFWASSTKPGQQGPLQGNQPTGNKPPQPLIQPIQPIVQPPPTNPQNKQTPPAGGDGKGRTTTFNQLFGLGPKG